MWGAWFEVVSEVSCGGMFTDREEEPPFDLGTILFRKKILLLC